MVGAGAFRGCVMAAIIRQTAGNVVRGYLRQEVPEAEQGCVKAVQLMI